MERQSNTWIGMVKKLGQAIKIEKNLNSQIYAMLLPGKFGLQFE